MPQRHASYAALADDPEVDAIYVSPPHPFHQDATLLALRGGKAVLCEKPFAMDLAEAQEMVSLRAIVGHPARRGDVDPVPADDDPGARDSCGGHARRRWCT